MYVGIQSKNTDTFVHILPHGLFNKQIYIYFSGYDFASLFQ
jgi:hypothetical protein